MKILLIRVLLLRFDAERCIHSHFNLDREVNNVSSATYHL